MVVGVLIFQYHTWTHINRKHAGRTITCIYMYYEDLRTGHVQAYTDRCYQYSIRSLTIYTYNIIYLGT
jgi:hypothetical protein